MRKTLIQLVILSSYVVIDVAGMMYLNTTITSNVKEKFGIVTVATVINN